MIIVIFTQTSGRKFLELNPVNLTALAAILDDLQVGAHAQNYCYGTQSTLVHSTIRQQNGGMLWTT